METAIIIGLLVAMVSLFIYALAGLLLGRYLASHHQDLWLRLGPPAGLASGPMNARLGEWLRRGGFRHLNDPTLLKWCPVVNRLRLASTVLFSTAVAGGILGGLLMAACKLIK